MHASLPAPIERYFSGRNARDFIAALAGFAPDAAVRDEGRLHRGADAIRTWMQDTTAKYDDRAEVTRSVTRDAEVEVVARVSGSFPGSPAPLRFRFTLEGDRIRRLEIGA